MKSSIIYLVKVFLTVIIITPVYHWIFDGILFKEPFSLSRFYSMGMLDEFCRWILLLIPVFLIMGSAEYFFDKKHIPARERNYTLCMIVVLGIATTSYLREWILMHHQPGVYAYLLTILLLLLLPYGYTKESSL